MQHIEIDHLHKAYGKTAALRDLTLSVAQGTFLTVFGPNGAGKTTLLHILATLSQPTSGVVRIHGFDAVADGEQVRRRIGVVSHQSFLYPTLTAYENLQFYGQMFGIANLEAVIDGLLEQIGLSERKHDLVRTFSRGMQQRLSVIRALLHNPPILLFDEPYSGLDQAATRALQQMLATAHAAGKTIVLTTHNLEKSLPQSDQIAILAQGELVYTGAAATVKKVS